MRKTTKKTARTRKPAAEKPSTKTTEAKAPREELCVFAFRLTEAERGAIHKAAGPAKASKFARNLLVAAATRDVKSIERILNDLGAKL